MKYLALCFALLLFACNTSSTEKEREVDTAKVDGTRLADTAIAGDSVPPTIVNPQPD